MTMMKFLVYLGLVCLVMGALAAFIGFLFSLLGLNC